eukprot:TRINITY_DN22409_c0_g1_i2.p2 TRINITY_DN22409_c0_g1~~TRINITY_DN22409_c0_g1_i2.p2  ORF type:complete len:467 (+),score=30.34 TRINITY_DN22409_c0_g1_i2:2418-3818(+)
MAQLRKVEWKKTPIPRLPEGRRAAPLRPRCVFPPCLIVHRAPESVSCWRCGCRARASCPEWKELAGEENALERFDKDPDVPDWCCPLCAYAVSTGEELEGELAEMKGAEEQVSEAAAAMRRPSKCRSNLKPPLLLSCPPSQTGPPPPGAQAPPPAQAGQDSRSAPTGQGGVLPTHTATGSSVNTPTGWSTTLPINTATGPGNTFPPHSATGPAGAQPGAAYWGQGMKSPSPEQSQWFGMQPPGGWSGYGAPTGVFGGIGGTAPPASTGFPPPTNALWPQYHVRPVQMFDSVEPSRVVTWGEALGNPHHVEHLWTRLMMRHPCPTTATEAGHHHERRVLLSLLRMVIFSPVARALPEMLHILVVRLEAILLREGWIKAASLNKDQAIVGSGEFEHRLASLHFSECTREKFAAAQSEARATAARHRPPANPSPGNRQYPQHNQGSGRAAGHKRKGGDFQHPQRPRPSQ